jgi:4a-hydroxytetrahydrobiopterin dehydratase
VKTSTSAAAPLTDGQIADGLAVLDGWARAGDAITRTFSHTYHECLHLAIYVGAKAREFGHRDLETAAHVDAIAAGHGAKLVPPETS